MNKIDALVGGRIRARRTALGHSQTELGDAVGVKFQQIQKYESGANRVSASRLWAIAAALDVPVTYFFEGLEAPEEAQGRQVRDKMEFLSDGRSIELARNFMRLPEMQKRAVLDIVESMTLARVEEFEPELDA